MMYLNDAGGRFKLQLMNDAGRTLCTLLWGDPLQEIARDGERVKVRARRRTGWLPASAVGDVGLLEIYIIDVGQGDGVLMRTPLDDAWHMIDAGIRAAEQMTRKGAANFVRWKFIDDLQRERVTLANMIVTPPRCRPLRRHGRPAAWCVARRAQLRHRRRPFLALRNRPLIGRRQARQRACR